MLDFIVLFLAGLSLAASFEGYYFNGSSSALSSRFSRSPRGPSTLSLSPPLSQSSTKTHSFTEVSSHAPGGYPPSSLSLLSTSSLLSASSEPLSPVLSISRPLPLSASEVSPTPVSVSLSASFPASLPASLAPLASSSSSVSASTSTLASSASTSVSVSASASSTSSASTAASGSRSSWYLLASDSQSSRTSVGFAPIISSDQKSSYSLQSFSRTASSQPVLSSSTKGSSSKPSSLKHSPSASESPYKSRLNWESSSHGLMSSSQSDSTGRSFSTSGRSVSISLEEPRNSASYSFKPYRSSLGSKLSTVSSLRPSFPVSASSIKSSLKASSSFVSLAPRQVSSHSTAFASGVSSTTLGSTTSAMKRSSLLSESNRTSSPSSGQSSTYKGSYSISTSTSGQHQSETANASINSPATSGPSSFGADLTTVVMSFTSICTTQTSRIANGSPIVSEVIDTLTISDCPCTLTRADSTASWNLFSESSAISNATGTQKDFSLPTSAHIISETAHSSAARPVPELQSPSCPRTSGFATNTTGSRISTLPLVTPAASAPSTTAVPLKTVVSTFHDVHTTQESTVINGSISNIQTVVTETVYDCTLTRAGPTAPWSLVSSTPLSVAASSQRSASSLSAASMTNSASVSSPKRYSVATPAITSLTKRSTAQSQQFSDNSTSLTVTTPNSQAPGALTTVVSSFETIYTRSQTIVSNGKTQTNVDIVTSSVVECPCTLSRSDSTAPWSLVSETATPSVRFSKFLSSLGTLGSTSQSSLTSVALYPSATPSLSGAQSGVLTTVVPTYETACSVPVTTTSSGHTKIYNTVVTSTIFDCTLTRSDITAPWSLLSAHQTDSMVLSATKRASTISPNTASSIATQSAASIAKSSLSVSSATPGPVTTRTLVIPTTVVVNGKSTSVQSSPTSASYFTTVVSTFETLCSTTVTSVSNAETLTLRTVYTSTVTDCPCTLTRSGTKMPWSLGSGPTVATQQSARTNPSTLISTESSAVASVAVVTTSRAVSSFSAPTEVSTTLLTTTSNTGSTISSQPSPTPPSTVTIGAIPSVTEHETMSSDSETVVTSPPTASVISKSFGEAGTSVSSVPLVTPASGFALTSPGLPNSPTTPVVVPGLSSVSTGLQSPTGGYTTVVSSFETVLSTAEVSVSSGKTLTHQTVFTKTITNCPCTLTRSCSTVSWSLAGPTSTFPTGQLTTPASVMTSSEASIDTAVTSSQSANSVSSSPSVSELVGHTSTGDSLTPTSVATSETSSLQSSASSTVPSLSSDSTLPTTPYQTMPRSRLTTPEAPGSSHTTAAATAFTVTPLIQETSSVPGLSANSLTEVASAAPGTYSTAGLTTTMKSEAVTAAVTSSVQPSKGATPSSDEALLSSDVTTVDVILTRTATVGSSGTVTAAMSVALESTGSGLSPGSAASSVSGASPGPGPSIGPSAGTQPPIPSLVNAARASHQVPLGLILAALLKSLLF